MAGKRKVVKAWAAFNSNGEIVWRFPFQHDDSVHEYPTGLISWSDTFGTYHYERVTVSPSAAAARGRK